jgi:nickel-dependent lactate racemase
MLGPEIRGVCRVVQHDASDRRRHSRLGPVLGSEVPVWVETEFLDQDLRITTGFIEPHFFAGFSGGPKMVVPGLCALETVLELHSASRIASPKATWGVTEGNPVHDAVREAAARVGVDFNVDVTLNRNREITGVFAGELFESHSAGCSFARSVAMVGVREPYDLVVGSNSGYPLDQNLYQAVKGMSAAAQIVKPGGTIVIAAQCADGFPEHGRYRKMLAESAGPSEFLAALPMGGQGQHDQWQVQIQAQILLKSRVMLKADGLSAESLKGAWLEPVADVTEAVTGSGATTVAVLPEGPLTIPYIA